MEVVLAGVCISAPSDAPVLSVGAVVNMPGQSLEVIAIKAFERSEYFPDSVAMARRVNDGWASYGDHVNSPWGIIKVV